VRDFVTRGLIGGVGNVVVFLPQILLLFFCIGLLEDSGYMARVAFLMDRIMKALGLHGRAFVPMLSGFACRPSSHPGTRSDGADSARCRSIVRVPDRRDRAGEPGQHRHEGATVQSQCLHDAVHQERDTRM